MITAKSSVRLRMAVARGALVGIGMNRLRQVGWLKWLLLVQKTVELFLCHSMNYSGIGKRIDKELDR